MKYLMRCKYVFLWIVVIWPQLGFAHKLQYSITELTWRADKHVLEVVHNIHLDDALTLLANLGDPGANLDVHTQAQLMLYMETSFQLQVLDRVLEPLAIGAQIDGDYLWIYQEHTLLTLPDELQVTSSLLQELYLDQRNQINLIIGEEVRSVLLHREHPTDKLRVTTKPD